MSGNINYRKKEKHHDIGAENGKWLNAITQVKVDPRNGNLFVDCMARMSGKIVVCHACGCIGRATS